VHLEDWTLAALLMKLAAPEPAPGGGTAAAVAAATAAALVEMSSAIALGPANADDRRFIKARDRAARLRSELLALAGSDLHSYQPVLEAMALEHGSPDRATALHAALSAACKVPLATAAAGAELCELGAVIAREGSPHLLGDATTAVLLAEAATRSAVRLVELNLSATPEDDRLAEAQDYAQRAAAARAATLVFPLSITG
jgi:methenyltetrahydrofolate cyclohydrolase